MTPASACGLVYVIDFILKLFENCVFNKYIRSQPDTVPSVQRSVIYALCRNTEIYFPFIINKFLY